MRHNVAIGLFVFATCLLALEGRADDTTAACPSGKCCEKSQAASCSACPTTADTPTCSKCTADKACPCKTQEVKAEASACTKCSSCKSCSAATQQVKAEGTSCKECTKCTADKACPCKIEQVKAEASACTKCTKCTNCPASTTATVTTTAPCATSPCATGKCCDKATASCPCQKGACPETQTVTAPSAFPGLASDEGIPLVQVVSSNMRSFGPRAAEGSPQGGARYSVQYRLVEGEGTTAEQLLSAPTLLINAGTTGTAGIHKDQEHVAGVTQGTDGKLQPVVSTIKAGRSVEVCVTPLAERKVQVEARLEVTSVGKSCDEGSPFQTEEERALQCQTSEVTTVAKRVVRVVTLGETIKISCGCACGSGNDVVLLTIDQVQVGEPAPGITPIKQVSAELEVNEMFDEVYQVGDLIEPYAIHKEGNAVDAADFLPVIDMLLSESKCDWPAKAQIRPFEEQHAVIITQTREGHEAIARYLSAKRAAVAEIEANLLRK